MTNKPMRQSSREVTDLSELTAIIDKCDVCRVAFIDDDFPYIVPLNFGYQLENDQLTLYFHCAGEGKKLDIIKQCNNVCFEMDTAHKLLTGDSACEWSMNFESIIGNGQIFLETDKSKKLIALEAIMKHYGGENLSFDENIVARTTVLVIKCTHFTGKRLMR